MTITVVDFDETGRLASYDIKNRAGRYRNDLEAEFGIRGNYASIYKYLAGTSNSKRGLNLNDVNPDADQEFLTVRNLGGENPIPETKTPFFKRFTEAGQPGLEGHVFFYILGNENLRFNNTTPIVTYSPHLVRKNDGLYAPYFVYPLEKGGRDVLMVHFAQGGSMPKTIGKTTVCNYPYDIGVVAKAQVPFIQETSLLIDPESETKGPPF